MKQLLLLPLLFAFSPLTAQRSSRNETDSLKFYRNLLFRVHRRYSDSMRHDSNYILLRNQVTRLQSESGDYVGFIMGGEVCHADYNAFNTSIAGSGFPALKSIAMRITIGFAFKTKRRLFELNFGSIGFNNVSKKGNEEIKTNLANLLQMNWGYNILRSKTAGIYPYAGLSLRSSTLQYKKPKELNNSYTNISDIITNEQSVNVSAGDFGWQLGLNIEALLSRKSGIMFYTRVATDRPFGKERYGIGDIKYDPGIRQGDWLVGFGFKFTGPR
ncbi:MAG: hypothetical protein QM791_22650 [Ferruginibacter sp.]